MTARLTIHGICYAYTQYPASKPRSTASALLLLHGFTGSKDNWTPLFPTLGASRTIIAPDLLGHADTDAPLDPARYAMPAAAADLAALVEELAIPSLDLLGYSMGGRLALYFALHYPHLVRRLVLESASPGLQTTAEQAARRASDEALAERIERQGLPVFVNEWEKIPLFASQASLPPETRLKQHSLRLRHTPVGLANSLRGMGAGAQPDLWTLLPALALPSLLLAGELDVKFRQINLQMAASIPQVQIEIIPSAGHTIHLEQPGAYLAAVIRFLDNR